MAYTLESLVEILEQDQYHFHLDTKLQDQIKSLLEKANFLRDLAQNVSFPSALPNDLESRIRETVHRAEDSIEICLTDQSLSNEDLELEFTELMEIFKSFEEEIIVLNIVEQEGCEIGVNSLHNTLLGPDRIPKNVAVGLDAHVPHLENLLAGSSKSKLKIISIIGADGVEYNLQTKLLALLSSLRPLTDEMQTLKCDRLGELVYLSLKCRRYLIVLDDMCNAHAWNEMKKIFPDDSNGSRIVITMSNEYAARHVSSMSNTYKLSPMDEDMSFELLRLKIYGEEKCPIEFKTLARCVLRRCQGSPLAITMMAGLITTSSWTLEFWELVMNKFCLELGEAKSREDPVFFILSLSYNHLPNCLKQCFLYVGAFSANSEIRASKIIKLWISERFVKSVVGKNLEDTAEAYLKTLVDRNLLIAFKHQPNGKVKSFKVHEALRRFCLEKSQLDAYFWFRELDGMYMLGEEEFMRRVSVNECPLSQPCKEREHFRPTRSFLCLDRASLHLAPMFLRMRLLKILDVFHLEFYQFPTEILQLVLLRFLALSSHSVLPPSISRLRNLQTLITRRLPSFRSNVLPSELWEMAELTHIKAKETCVIMYSPTNTDYFQEKLHSLTHIQVLGVINEFLEKLRNLRKLGIFCNSSMHNVIDLACLQKLERLKGSSDWSLASHTFLSHLTFPSSLKKLTLCFCKITGEVMSRIGLLPNLEELKVQKSDFLEMRNPGEPLWKSSKEEFAELLSLCMEDLNLVVWEANESSSFKKLEYLTVKSCPSLVIIPYCIAMRTQIKVDKSSPTLETLF